MFLNLFKMEENNPKNQVADIGARPREYTGSGGNQILAFPFDYSKEGGEKPSFPSESEEPFFPGEYEK